MRVGMGYDVHSLAENRHLILGGVTISFKKGLAGHSDADVLVHAIMDALLGAAGEGDIGYHFPDNDPRYEGVSSLVLLGEVGRLIKKRGLRIINIDTVIVAQAPKLASYILQMKSNISEVLGVSTGQVNIKATTTEGLGFCGQGQGMATYAVALLDES